MTVSSEILRGIGAPDRLETSLGTLEFRDGVPSGEAADKLYDHLDFVHAVNAYLDGFAAASTYAIRKGFHDAGAADNSFIIFSQLMGSESVFLTANADTVYYVGVIDLSSGPMVVETPPQALGVIDDMWWGWIIDFGLPGPDRGEGGRFLLVPPGYDGTLPDSGYHVGHSRTSRALVLGRSFLTNDDPAPTVETIKRTLKVYPYAAGAAGTSVATLLRGGALPAAAAAARETVFVEGSGNAFNTVPPSDYGFFELMNEAVQDEPAGSTNPELLGQLAAIGIVKGEPFEPDARMRRILDDAAAVGNATSRALFFNYRDDEGFGFYDNDSAWFNMLWVGGYTFETPPPMVTKTGIEPFPTTGARKLHSRTSFLYAATGVSPAMCMRLTGLGSQYLMAVRDSAGKPLRWLEDLSSDAAGQHPGCPLLVVHGLRQ